MTKQTAVYTGGTEFQPTTSGGYLVDIPKTGTTQPPTVGEVGGPTPKLAPPSPSSPTEPMVAPGLEEVSAPTPVTYDKPPAFAQEAMTGLLASDSPYLEEARQRGMQHAASRGLLSSSIAGGAAETAAIQAAAPIALADAGTASQAYQSGIDVGEEKWLQDMQRGFQQGLQTQSLEAQAASNAAAQVVNVATSDMPAGVKNEVTAAVYDILGVTAPEGGAVADVSPQETYSPENYQDVRDQFGGDFASFVKDSEAKSGYATDVRSPTKGVTALEMGFRREVGGDIRGTGWADKINKEFGNWPNAVNAARTWLGPGASDYDVYGLLGTTLGFGATWADAMENRQHYDIPEYNKQSATFAGE